MKYLIIAIFKWGTSKSFPSNFKDFESCKRGFSAYFGGEENIISYLVLENDTEHPKVVENWFK